MWRWLWWWWWWLLEEWWWCGDSNKRYPDSRLVRLWDTELESLDLPESWKEIRKAKILFIQAFFNFFTVIQLSLYNRPDIIISTILRTCQLIIMTYHLTVSSVFTQKLMAGLVEKYVLNDSQLGTKTAQSGNGQLPNGWGNTFPNKGWKFSLRHYIQISSKINWASYPVSTWSCIQG